MEPQQEESHARILERGGRWVARFLTNDIYVFDSVRNMDGTGRLSFKFNNGNGDLSRSYYFSYVNENRQRYKYAVCMTKNRFDALVKWAEEGELEFVRASERIEHTMPKQWFDHDYEASCTSCGDSKKDYSLGSPRPCPACT
jgi:hypothetical protein